MTAITESPPAIASGLGKTALRIALALLLLAAAALTARWWFAEGRFIETTDNAYVQADIATLAARIDGDVIAVRVADNQAVKAGDALIELDPKDWQANDQAVAALRKAEAGLNLATAQRAVSEQALGVAEAQVQSAEARVVSAEAALRLAESNLANTSVRAPFDGVVGNRAAQLGQHVQPGQQLIAIAPPAARMFVVANFKETQLRRMHPGDRVRLVPDIDPEGAVSGHVDSLAPATGALFSLLPPENATGNFTKVVQRVPVRIVLELPDGKAPTWVRAGLSVTAEVDTRGADAVRHGLFSVRGTCNPGRRWGGGGGSGSCRWCSACSWRSWISRSFRPPYRISRRDCRPRPMRRRGCRRAI